MANERKSPPVVFDRAQIQEMQRLELGEAMATGDQDRVKEIVDAKVARGDRDIGYEMSKSQTAYTEFEEKEAQRANEFKPVSAAEMREQQAEQPSVGEQKPELTPDQAEIISSLEAVQNSQARRQGNPGSFDELKEQSQGQAPDQSKEQYEQLSFFADLHPEQGPEHDH